MTERVSQECVVVGSSWDIVITSEDISERQKLKEKRLEVCNSCEHMKTINGKEWTKYCGLCMCSLELKPALKWAKCPIGKWKDIT